MASSSGAFSGTEPDSESEPESIGAPVESQHASGASTSEESNGGTEPHRGERELQPWGEWEPQLEDFDLSSSSVSNSDEDYSDAEAAGQPAMPRMPQMPSSSSDSGSSDYSDSGCSSFASESSDADSDAEWEPEHFMLYLLQGQLKEPLSPTSREMTAMWAFLPEEVLERVFAMTPLASQCRFRVVSRAWRKRLSSLAFRQLCASVTRPPTGDSVICAMEHMPRSWPLHRSDLWLWGKTGNLEMLRVDASYLPARFRACVSSMVVQGGLVCIYTTAEGGGIQEPSASLIATRQDRHCDPHTAESRRSIAVVGLKFCVVNPVTAAWKELPPEPVVNDGYEQRTLEGSWRVLLEVGKDISGNFKVVVVSTRPSMLWKFKQKATLSIYSSSSDSWEVIHLTSPSPLLKRLADGRDEDLRRWPEHAICKGQLFSMDGRVLNVHSLPTGKFVSQTSFQGLFYPPYRGLQHPGVDYSNLDGLRSVYGIFAHSERLFCVGEGLMGKAQRFGIWELDTTMNLWFLTSFLPIKLENEVMSRMLNRLSLRRGTLVGSALWLAFHLSSSRNGGVLPRHTVLIGYHFPSDSWNLKSKGWPSVECYDVFQILQPGNLGFEQCVQAAMSRKAKTLAEKNDVDVTT